MPGYDHLRIDLSAPLPAPVWPPGTGPACFDPDQHARAVHDVLRGAYTPEEGGVAPFEAWWEALRQDSEYDPALVFLAHDRGGQTVGFAQCWTSAFVKDLAVSQAWRRKGVGRALLLQAFACFRERGAAHVDLKVEHRNASGAARLYRSLGMMLVRRVEEEPRRAVPETDRFQDRS
jgi:ribosomal protein S18 acetylase RimI-like enzyme